jgi:hypothetical protein
MGGINIELTGPTVLCGDIQVITDEEANEIYLKVSTHVQNRKGYIKKNWTEDETKLLKWAVITYTKQRNINY